MQHFDPSQLARASAPAKRAFADFLARVESGESLEFERFCAEHVEHASELARLHAMWLEFSGVLDSSPSVRSLSQRLTQRFGAGIDPAISLEREIERLAQRGGAHGRYRIVDEVGRGGMGSILRVWDDDLRRTLAMKRMRDDADGDACTPNNSRALSRFLEEAQVTGQLDHPGVVPVHELGLDAEGRVYFTMKLVQGRTFADVIEHVHAARDGWTLTRALNVLHKVCETVAYAHERGVIHRDLKPSNVMVGDFGAVYVMDWGLAHVAGQVERKDVRIRDDDNEGAPLATMDGDVLGTPAYMSPQQAAGKTSEVGPAWDVYALGAMLYHLLTMRAPYAGANHALQPRAMLALCLLGPPKSVQQLAPDVPDELAAICAKAMAREPARRYATALALAGDLQAWLEGRVVRAHATGTWVELKKWIGRNRVLVTAVSSVVVALAAGFAVSALLYFREKRTAEQSRLLADLYVFQSLASRVDDLWPATPERVRALEQWLAQVDELGTRRAKYERRLAELDATNAADVAVDDTREARRSQLQEVCADFQRFLDPEHGLSEGGDREHGLGVRRRLESERDVATRSLGDGAAKASWDVAIASISDRDECPAYGGLRIRPQFGLVPIGRDAVSGLWEFAHLASGEIAEREPSTGRAVLAEDSGVVLVLLPGGEFWMGAQSTDPHALNYDAFIARNATVQRASVSPFFLSKYEMTQSQWARVAYANPAEIRAGTKHGDSLVTPLHPIEHVNWLECAVMLWRLALTFPTQAQWEYAAREGRTQIWSDDHVLIANLADDSFGLHQLNPFHDFMPGADDGYARHAPVGHFPPNAFGLFDVIGNVYEFCSDEPALVPNDMPAAQPVHRGGSFVNRPDLTSLSSAGSYAPTERSVLIGLRPAREIEP